jgi:hypothetical protein
MRIATGVSLSFRIWPPGWMSSARVPSTCGARGCVEGTPPWTFDQHLYAGRSRRFRAHRGPFRRGGPQNGYGLWTPTSGVEEKGVRGAKPRACAGRMTRRMRGVHVLRKPHTSSPTARRGLHAGPLTPRNDHKGCAYRICPRDAPRLGPPRADGRRGDAMTKGMVRTCWWVFAPAGSITQKGRSHEQPKCNAGCSRSVRYSPRRCCLREQPRRAVSFLIDERDGCETRVQGPERLQGARRVQDGPERVQGAEQLQGTGRLQDDLSFAPKGSPAVMHMAAGRPTQALVVLLAAGAGLSVATLYYISSIRRRAGVSMPY